MHRALDLVWYSTQLGVYIALVIVIIVVSAAGVLAAPVAGIVWTWRKLRAPRRLRAQTFFGSYDKP